MFTKKHHLYESLPDKLPHAIRNDHDNANTYRSNSLTRFDASDANVLRTLPKNDRVTNMRSRLFRVASALRINDGGGTTRGSTSDSIERVAITGEHVLRTRRDLVDIVVGVVVVVVTISQHRVCVVSDTSSQTRTHTHSHMRDAITHRAENTEPLTLCARIAKVQTVTQIERTVFCSRARKTRAPTCACSRSYVYVCVCVNAYVMLM